MEYSWYRLLLGVLAVWRVTHLLHVEHGPWGLLAGMRALGARVGTGELFDCFFCLSLWTAIPFAWWLGGTLVERLVTWLALSSGAVLVEVRLLGVPPVEDRDGLLR